MTNALRCPQGMGMVSRAGAFCMHTSLSVLPRGGTCTSCTVSSEATIYDAAHALRLPEVAAARARGMRNRAVEMSCISVPALQLLSSKYKLRRTAARHVDSNAGVHGVASSSGRSWMGWRRGTGHVDADGTRETGESLWSIGRKLSRNRDPIRSSISIHGVIGPELSLSKKLGFHSYTGSSSLSGAEVARFRAESTASSNAPLSRKNCLKKKKKMMMMMMMMMMMGEDWSESKSVVIHAKHLRCCKRSLHRRATSSQMRLVSMASAFDRWGLLHGHHSDFRCNRSLQQTSFASRCEEPWSIHRYNTTPFIDSRGDSMPRAARVFRSSRKKEGDGLDDVSYGGSSSSRRSSKDQRPVQVIYGTDVASIEAAVEEAISGVIQEGWAHLNSLQLRNVEDHETLLSAMQTLMTAPLVGTCRATWLIKPAIMSKRCPDWLQIQLQEMVKRLPSSTRLVITLASVPSTSWRKAFLFPEFMIMKEFADVDVWNDAKRIEQVHKAAAKGGLLLSAEAAKMLAEFSAGSRLTLDKELEKLSLLAMGSAHGYVDEDTVAALIPTGVGCLRSAQLADRIREGDIKGVLKGLDLVLGVGKDEPLSIVSAILAKFRTWFLVRAGMVAGKTDSQIAEALQLRNPKRLFFLKSEAKSLSMPVLKGCLEVAFETEVSLKTGATVLGSLTGMGVGTGSQFRSVSYADGSRGSASQSGTSQLVKMMVISMCDICQNGKSV